MNDDKFQHNKCENSEMGADNPWDALRTVEFAGGGLNDEQVVDEELGRQTLAAFEHFFKINTGIKDAIAEAAPSDQDFYNEDSRMHYLDRASKEFVGFERDFQTMAREFRMGDSVSESTQKFFKQGEADFATSNFDPDNVRRIYEKRLYQMRDDFVDEVHNEAIGYKVDIQPERLISHANSVNELLHAYHSLIMNNQDILQRIPPIEQKGEIILRGEEGGLGDAVYQVIDENLDVDETDIISVDDKMLMMVRGRAHALMIEAEPFKERPGEVIVHYNVPKVINREMVEALPGVNRINDNTASGRFAVPEAEFGQRIVDFIEQVPTDKDNLRVQRLRQRMLSKDQLIMV